MYYLIITRVSRALCGGGMVWHDQFQRRHGSCYRDDRFHYDFGYCDSYNDHFDDQEVL